MDNLTKGFVIAACSVVIATPIVWFGGRVLEARRQEQLSALRAEEQAEKERRMARVPDCHSRAVELFPFRTDAPPDYISKKAAFLTRCVDSTKPVAEVKQ